MLRIFYQWRVAAQDLKHFEEVWRKTTRSIHKTVPGALGSFCVQHLDNKDQVMTVALWKNEACWRAFAASAAETHMKALHDIAEQVTVTPYVQLGDETKGASSGMSLDT